MKIYSPNYFDTFRCIASACPDSCCKEWAVDVDEEAAAFYRGLSGPLGDRLREVLSTEDGSTVMTIEDGRCPMWRQDGLCRIQAELGHEALCQTCREFPRLRHEYGSFTELGLELSCPEAARLILASDGSVWEEDRTADQDSEDPELLQILCNSRKTALEFLHTTTLPLPQALAVILLYGHSVQAQIDGGDEAELDVAGCLDDARRYAGPGDRDGFFGTFLNLEMLTESWHQRLLGGPVGLCWSRELKAMAAYMIRRYWLQAVADFDLICRVKLVIAGVLLVALLGGDVLQTAQLFSKEIENDPDNVDALLDGAYTDPGLTDANLLGLLLNT